MQRYLLIIRRGKKDPENFFYLPDEFEDWLMDVLRRYTPDNVSIQTERKALIAYLSNCRKGHTPDEVREAMRKAKLSEDKINLYYQAMQKAKLGQQGEPKSKVRQN